MNYLFLFLQPAFFNEQTCFTDNETDEASDDSTDKVGEIRFVPEDKSICKMLSNLFVLMINAFSLRCVNNVMGAKVWDLSR